MSRLAYPIAIPAPQLCCEAPFLVLGQKCSDLPGVDLSGRVGTPITGIILLGRVANAELDAGLDQAPDPAVPIADFGGNEGLRKDFVGTSLEPASFREMEQSFAAIRRRLAEFPFKAELDSRAQFTALRIAYSRATAIEAGFAPNSRHLVEYPLLGPIAGARHLLEDLADLELLRPSTLQRARALSTLVDPVGGAVWSGFRRPEPQRALALYESLRPTANSHQALPPDAT
jgi:hypothetical protein